MWMRTRSVGAHHVLTLLILSGFMHASLWHSAHLTQHVRWKYVMLSSNLSIHLLPFGSTVNCYIVELNYGNGSCYEWLPVTEALLTG